jgi:tRNA-2-methylthio-N6-dimethylallyladenosine synthase
MQELETLSSPADIVSDNKRLLYIESYGCAMNFSDSEIIGSIMTENGFDYTQNEFEADVVFFKYLCHQR